MSAAIDTATALPRRWRDLVDLGFSVIPVKHGGKLPLGKWKAYHLAHASPDTIAQWAARESNIGIVTGAISGLIVLDADSAEATAEVERRGIPDTVTVETARGIHYYFRHPGGTIGNRAGLLPGVDIRGDGGFVVAPDSIHPDGPRYRWGNPPGLFDLAPPPQWLLDLLAKPETKPAEPTSIASSAYGERAIDNELSALRRANEGERNDALNRAAFNLAQLAAGGVIGEENTKAHLRATAAAIGLEPGEIDATIESGWKAGSEHPRRPEPRPETRTEQFQRGSTRSEYIDPETGEVLGDAIPKPARAFQFIAIGDLKYRQPEFLVDGMIETDTLNELFGDPGHGKSFVCTDIGASVATGTPFHGRKVKQGPVFLIAGEGHNGLARRFAAWSKARGVSVTDAPLFMSNRPAQFLDAASAAQVAEAVHALAAQHGPPVLIVIDTLARNFGPGDENSTSDMGAFIAAVDDLKAQFPGCAVLLVHHSGHGDKQRARGAMALKGALDCEYRVAMAGDIIRVSNTKMKDAEPPAPLAFNLKQVDLGDGATSAVLVQTEAPERERQLTKAQLLAKDTFIAAARDSDEFAQVHLDTWQAAFLSRHTGDNDESKKRAFRRARAELVDAGLLSVTDDVYRAECPTLIAELRV